MTLEEFNRVVIEAEDYLALRDSGVCYSLNRMNCECEELFYKIFKPTPRENIKWNMWRTSYWLGNGLSGSLSRQHNLDLDITRFIALGLFKEIVIEEKLYLELGI